MITKIREKILNSKNIIITAHISPDGDAIGAGIALLKGVEKLNKDCKARFILQDKVPDKLKFLDLTRRIESFDSEKNYDFDLAICVDSATLERTGNVKELIKDSFIINIDHHISNPEYGVLNYVKNISSTSEIVYNLLKEWNVEIDIEMGEGLYTGLVNDTGNFQHDNVTVNTFKMAGDLVNLGVNNSKIIREFWNRYSMPGVKLLGKAMYEMEFFEDKKLAYFFLSNEDLKRFNGRKEDTESIVEKLIAYEDADVSLFLREDKPGFIKGSMRSKHDTDVNIIASNFGGGGHKKAAGFSSELPPEEILKVVMSKL